MSKKKKTIEIWDAEVGNIVTSKLIESKKLLANLSILIFAYFILRGKQFLFCEYLFSLSFDETSSLLSLGN